MRDTAEEGKLRQMLDRADRQLKRSELLLDYRRINWRHVAAPRIYEGFNAVFRVAREIGFPFQFQLDHVQTPNEEVIQLRASKTYVGVVNRKEHAPWEPAYPHTDRKVLEEGGELVASQSSTGHVFFLVTPRRSERSTPSETELILMGPLDPNDVTPGVVRKATRRYLVLLKATSSIGGDSLGCSDWLLYQWTYTFELRAKYDLVRSAVGLKNEWLKASVTAVIAILAGFVLAKYGIKSS